MQKPQKEYILEQLNILSTNHDEICNLLSLGEIEKALSLVISCQEKAIAVGSVIENFEGDGHKTVGYLEEYCELLFDIHSKVSSGEANEKKISADLKKAFDKIIKSASEDIKVKKEAVFLPYKASMWDSLESIWKRYDADPEWDAYVIPIPYFERNPEGEFVKRIYEGADFPKYVPIVSYKEYDFEKRHPDEIYIINPYDGLGFVTSVDPFFYTTNIKQFTDCLIYVPYFVLMEPDFNNPASIEAIAQFVTLPGVLNSHKTILQSEAMKKAYLEVLVKKFGESSRDIWNKRLFGTGSPKIEKIMNAKLSDFEIPKEWQKKIDKKDGSKRKIVLYNTTLGAFLDAPDRMIEKMERVFETFKEQTDDIVLLWRPHPLLRSTISSMHPELLKDFDELVSKYKKEDFGIYDDTAEMDRALILSDAYYGDMSSLTVLYQKLNKPIMIQNVGV